MRAELLGHVIAAQFDLEKLLTELTHNGTSASAALDQVRALTALQRQIGNAGPAALTTLRAEVTATINASQAVALESRSAIADAITASGAGLSGNAAAARQQVNTVMASMHQYDKFLQFSPGDTEADYRQREAERRKYIEAQQAKGTPEGDLNAAGGAIGQLVDVKAHGAGDSSEFQQRWNELVTTTEKLRDEVRRSGGSTAEFDTHLREDLRRILKAKGLSDAQINAQFSANPDPLAAAKAFVDDRDVQAMELRRDTTAFAALADDPLQVIAAPTPAAATGTLGDAVDELKSMGIFAIEYDAASDPSHGVTLASVAAVKQSITPR